MTEQWKDDFGLWEKLSFKERKDVIKDVADNIIYLRFKKRRSCDKHLKALGNLLLKAVDDPYEVLKHVTAIYKVIE